MSAIRAPPRAAAQRLSVPAATRAPPTRPHPASSASVSAGAAGRRTPPPCARAPSVGSSAVPLSHDARRPSASAGAEIVPTLPGYLHPRRARAPRRPPASGCRPASTRAAPQARCPALLVSASAVELGGSHSTGDPRSRGAHLEGRSAGSTFQRRRDRRPRSGTPASSASSTSRTPRRASPRAPAAARRRSRMFVSSAPPLEALTDEDRSHHRRSDSGGGAGIPAD